MGGASSGLVISHTPWQTDPFRLNHQGTQGNRGEVPRAHLLKSNILKKHMISNFYALASPLFLEGISSLHLSSLQQGDCRASGWTCNRGSVICWQPLPLVQPSHLMPTMKLLPHYLPDCQGGAPNQYTIHPFHLHWSGRLARACVSASAQTNRLVESSGVGWLTAHVCFWVVFYTGCLLLGRMLSPLKCIYR